MWDIGSIFLGCPYIYQSYLIGTPVPIKQLWKIRVNISYKSAATYDTTKTHYNDVIMSVIASQITSLTIIYSTVYLGTNQRKHQSVTGLCESNSPVRAIHHFWFNWLGNALLYVTFLNESVKWWKAFCRGLFFWLFAKSSDRIAWSGKICHGQQSIWVKSMKKNDWGNSQKQHFEITPKCSLACNTIGPTAGSIVQIFILLQPVLVDVIETTVNL